MTIYPRERYLHSTGLPVDIILAMCRNIEDYDNISTWEISTSLPVDIILAMCRNVVVYDNISTWGEISTSLTVDIILAMCRNIEVDDNIFTWEKSTSLPVNIILAMCRNIEVYDNIHVRDIKMFTCGYNPCYVSEYHSLLQYPRDGYLNFHLWI